jgi:6-methylsalicylate decarboxylase
MRVDVHAHLFTHDFLDLMSELGTTADALAPSRLGTPDPLEADLEQRFTAMGLAGVTHQILSAGALVPSFPDEGAALRASRAINDLHAALCDAHPDRFSFLAALPLPHPRAAMSELDRMKSHPGCVGAAATTAVVGDHLDDPALHDVFAALSERRTVLLAHPVGDACGSPTIEAEHLTWPVGAPFEDTLFVLRLLRADWLDRFPGVRVVVPHLGGALPFLMERLDYMSPRYLPSGRRASTEARRLWFDSVNAHPPALRCAVETFGEDRVLLGTDYPMWRGDFHTSAVEYVTRSGLSAATVERVMRQNARELFGSRVLAAGR